MSTTPACPSRIRTASGWERLVTVDDSITLNGDSGGPWFNGTDAAGIHQGLIRIGWGPWRSSFSRIGYADNALPGIGLLVMPPH